MGGQVLDGGGQSRDRGDPPLGKTLDGFQRFSNRQETANKVDMSNPFTFDLYP